MNPARSKRITSSIASSIVRARRPAGQLPERCRVGLAPSELLEALVVGVLVRHELDLGARAERAITRRARLRMEISVSQPMLKTCPRASSQSSSRVMASTVSCTCAKQRVCVPSPKTVSGPPAHAWRAKRGRTMPYGRSGEGRPC